MKRFNLLVFLGIVWGCDHLASPNYVGPNEPDVSDGSFEPEFKEEEVIEEKVEEIAPDLEEEEIAPSYLLYRRIEPAEMWHLTANEANHITFTYNDQLEKLAQEVEVGTIINSSYDPTATLGESVVAPRRVKGKVIEGDQLVFYTEPVGLFETLKAAGVEEGKVEFRLEPSDESRGPSDYWTLLDDVDAEIEVGEVGPVEVAAVLQNATVKIRNPVFLFNCQFSSSGNSVDFSFSGQMEIQFDAGIEVSGGLMDYEPPEVPIAPLFVAPLVGAIGPVPVVVIVEVDLRAGVNINVPASVSVTVPVEATEDYRASVHYDNTAGWSSRYDFSPTLHLSSNPTVRFHTEGDVEIYVVPVLTAKLYAVAGPRWDLLKVAIDGQFTPFDLPPCWEIISTLSSEYAFLDVSILGWGFEAGQGEIFRRQIWQWSQTDCGIGFDQDGDGYGMGEDCDDSNPSIHPGATEICGNRVDEDCDGSDAVCPAICECTDGDRDGYYPLSCRDADCPNRTDCDDSRSEVHPGATEVCDGLDNDCDTAVDEGGVCTPPEVCNGIDDNGDTRCDEGYTCCRGAIQTQACGFCGTQSRTCDASCNWGAWSSCSGTGICSPGAVETRSCPCGGTESRTCTSSCSWGPWTGCSTVCTPGATRSCTTSCSSTGTQTCASDGCSWGTCTPPSETCNGRDDDCDGQVDEGCCSNECTTPGERRCYSSTQYQSCAWGTDGCLHWSLPLNCGSGQRCTGSGVCECDPVSHASYRCNTSDGNIHWYNSCGADEGVKENCTYGCTTGSTSCNTPTCADLCTGRECGTVSGCNCGTCPSEKTCNSSGQCVPRCTATVAVTSSRWEDYSSGCDSWWLGLNVSISAGSLYCKQISTTRESSPSGADVTLRNGNQTIDANGSCCLSPSDEIIAVFACECSGTAYINSHWTELLNGTYDPSKLTFYQRATHSCAHYHP